MKGDLRFMNWTAWPIVLWQASLTGCALLLSLWIHMPWPATVGIALLGATSTATAVGPCKPPSQAWTWSAAMLGLGTLIILTSLLAAPDQPSLLDEYYAVFAWLMGASLVFPAHRLAPGAARTQWRIGGMIWAFGGGVLWLGASYLRDLRGEFYVGLLVNLALLILCKSWFRMPSFGIQAVNTLILLVIGLPLVDLFVRPHYRLDAHPDLRRRPYSYETATKDPAAYAAWQAWSGQQWSFVVKNFLAPDRTRLLPWRLKPGCRAFVFESEVAINSRGFRGKEISEPKGATYRIVALGESTTFGTTLASDDQPWPDLLEQLIRDRLQPRRPVEIINAGVPGYTLGDNLHRLSADILPLKPDMIISYHGFNGFPLLSEAMPRVYGDTPPRYRSRPLKLLADCEFSLKMYFFRRRLMSNLALHPPAFSDPLESKYARAYRELISAAGTNGIRLVLASYSMAVNAQSDPAIIEFYRAAGFPAVHWQIRANAAHSLIVRQLAAEQPEVCGVDTRPHLDGEHGKFIDLIHFNHDGDRQLADTLFEGIRKVLQQDLGQSAPTP